MGMDLQTHRRADIRQMIKNVKRDKNQITDATDIDNHLARLLLREFAADLRDHIEPSNEVKKCPIGRSPPTAAARPNRRRRFGHRLGNPAGKRLPVEVADRRCQSISGVRRHRSRHFQQRSNHHLHLLLGRVTVTDHGGLDLHRAIFMNFDILFGGREQRNAARLAELQRALNILGEKDFFQTDAVRLELAHDLGQFGVNAKQASCLGLGARRMDRTMAHMAQRVANDLNDPPAGRHGSRIDAQDDSRQRFVARVRHSG